MQIKARLECIINENQTTQKSTKAKLDKMDDEQMKNHKIDVMMYNTLEDILDELASDEQELLFILKNKSWRYRVLKNHETVWLKKIIHEVKTR